MQMCRVDAEAQMLADCDDIPAGEQRTDLTLSASVGGSIEAKAHDPLVAVFLYCMRHHVDSRPVAGRVALDCQIGGPQTHDECRCECVRDPDAAFERQLIPA